MTKTVHNFAKLIGATTFVAALVFAFAAWSGNASAAPADIVNKADGSLLVSVPGEGTVVVPANEAHQLGQIMRMDHDQEAENRLADMMQQSGRERISALAIAAASEDPDRTALVAAAAIRADEEEGVKAANALRYVRGTHKRQILLGAHSSGNRSAYRRVRGAFAEDQHYMAGGGPAGGVDRGIGTASDRGRGIGNPLGLGHGNDPHKLPLNRFQ